MVVLEGHRAEERILPVGEGVGPHRAAPVLPSLAAAAAGVRRHLVVEAEDVLLQHVSLESGLLNVVSPAQGQCYKTFYGRNILS